MARERTDEEIQLFVESLPLPVQRTLSEARTAIEGSQEQYPHVNLSFADMTALASASLEDLGAPVGLKARNLNIASGIPDRVGTDAPPSMLVTADAISFRIPDKIDVDTGNFALDAVLRPLAGALISKHRGKTVTVDNARLLFVNGQNRKTRANTIIMEDNSLMIGSISSKTAEGADDPELARFLTDHQGLVNRIVGQVIGGPKLNDKIVGTLLRQPVLGRVASAAELRITPTGVNIKATKRVARAA